MSQWRPRFLTPCDAIRPQWVRYVNVLRPRRNEQHFADDIFKRIFFNENVWILIKISLKFVPKGPINNIPALVQIMAWRRSGDKPLSETMMVSLPTHICITRPQWVIQLTVGWQIKSEALTDWPRWCGSKFESIIFRYYVMNSTLGARYEISLRWMPQQLTNQPTLVQVMAWGRQATRH